MNPYTLVPFSENDIDLLCKSIAAMGLVQVEGSLKQVDSQYSLVFHDDKKYYKYCLDSIERVSLFTFLGKSSNRLVFPQQMLGVEFDEAAPFPFFVFPKQRFQLTSLRISQLKSCLFNLASGIKDALEELHGKYKYAHLDVRLANVCFDDGHVKLIDFDRCQHTSVKDVASKYNNHYMYTYSAGVANPNASLFGLETVGSADLFHIEAFVVTKRLSNVFMISHHQQGRSLIIVIMPWNKGYQSSTQGTYEECEPPLNKQIKGSSSIVLRRTQPDRAKKPKW
ncbi:hypothetical protein EMCRGX_G016860 [Ephydatia muelleri]